MKKILFAGAVFALVPFVSFAQTATTTAVQATGTITITTTITDPGLIPGDFFYFLDRWSEALGTSFSFNKEKKARKHLEYAKERVAEMSEVLKGSEAKLDDIAEAKADFDERVAKAATLVRGEKDKGSDVSKLARELDDELEASLEALKDIFKEHKDKSSRAEEVIRAKLASLAPGDPQIQGLTQALLSIVKEKDEADNENNDLDIDLEDEQEFFDEMMGKEMAAKRHMEKAMRLRNIDGALMQISTSSVQLMKQAQEAMQRGDFEVAKRLSKEAERVLENAKEMREVLEGGSFEEGTSSIDGMMDDDMDIDESPLNDLEKEIKKGERMMEDFNR